MIVLGFSGIQNGEAYREKFGLRFVGHDASVALIADGRLLFAAEEERFNRVKHTSEFPVGALSSALESTGVSIGDIDRIAYPWKVDFWKLMRMGLHHGPKIPARHAPALAIAGLSVVRDLMSPKRVATQFSRLLGDPLPPCQGVNHHRSHSAAAYFLSPFEDAAVLTIDGQGEDESGTLAEWQGVNCRHIQSIRSPNSIGILYGMVTDFLGMRAAWDEYKVMGMAAYGDPSRFLPDFEKLVSLSGGGRFSTRRTAMVFRPGYCDVMLADRFRMPPRKHGEELEQIHFDLAAALQAITEKTIFHVLRHLRRMSKSNNLCLGGGVFQNSVINGKIHRSGIFGEVFIPPIPGDNGVAAGAALQVYYEGNPDSPRIDAQFDVFSGPGLEPITPLINEFGHLQFRQPDDIIAAAADLLARRKVIAWVQGRMEIGARALGHRSILASPLDRAMRDQVNTKVKHREEFRPFAGSVPAELASEFFELGGSSPFMQRVVTVIPGAVEKIGAVSHFGTCRAQTVSKESDPGFHALLLAFGDRTGVPLLLNTSFNDADEPIVCSARDALRSFSRMNLDALVLGDFLVTRLVQD